MCGVTEHDGSLLTYHHPNLGGVPPPAHRNMGVGVYLTDSCMDVKYIKRVQKLTAVSNLGLQSPPPANNNMQHCWHARDIRGNAKPHNKFKFYVGGHPAYSIHTTVYCCFYIFSWNLPFIWPFFATMLHGVPACTLTACGISLSMLEMTSRACKRKSKHAT